MTPPPLLLVNFSHPLSAAQIEQISQLLSQPPDCVITAPVQFDPDLPFQPQVSALLASLPISAEQWQTSRILMVPPAFSPITAVLLAELHGRMGYFPAIVRLKMLNGAQPPVYAPAEIINLQSLRDAARQDR